MFLLSGNVERKKNTINSSLVISLIDYLTVDVIYKRDDVRSPSEDNLEYYVASRCGSKCYIKPTNFFEYGERLLEFFQSRRGSNIRNLVYIQIRLQIFYKI